jgi:serine/threonine protein phosphatase 1
MTLLGRWGWGGAKRAERSEAPDAHAVPSGWRIYAVGDIHGRYDLMSALGEFVAQEIRENPPKLALTIFLGDYVDRGPQSFDVIERLAAADWPTPIVTLTGNHEDTMRRFLDDAAILDMWKQWGGLETLLSYGVDVQPAMLGRNYKVVQEDFVQRLPASHRHFLGELEASISIGDYFFCHAGIRPGIPLDRQKREDLIMIREPFLSSATDHGKVVVHGHTPTERAVLQSNRIGIDTGAFATGRLTALALEGSTRRLITAQL